MSSESHWEENVSLADGNKWPEIRLLFAGYPFAPVAHKCQGKRQTGGQKGLEALLKIKCCDCQSTYIGETGRNLSTRLTESKRATRNQQQSHCWSPFTDETSNRLGLCDMYYVFSDYYQRLSLEIWFTENKRHWIVVNSYRHRTNDFIDGLKQNYNYERMTGQPTIWLS